MPEIVFPCLKEMSAIPEEEMAEAKAIVVERAVVDEISNELVVQPGNEDGGDNVEDPCQTTQL